MSKDIFISYSRRDQEFVSRLADDLNAHVAGVWFDQSTIQAGQKWHDEILEGIHECKAFVLVLSPDAVESRYVREELDKALELGKPIFPVIYRPAKWTDEFASLIKDIQTIDLRSGSYTDNFHKLVDGLIEAGAIKSATYERPFLREPTKISLSLVFRKAVSWAFAWSLGWLLFWAMTFIFLFIFIAVQNKAGWEDILNFLTFSLSGITRGFVGGFVAGLWSMFALRPYAPSISWKHISPTIRVWAVSGPIGIIISGIITVIMLIIGLINAQNELPRCPGIGFAECLSQIFVGAYREPIGTIILIVAVFILFLIVVWFLTGLLAGWLVVRHVRKLEPGITSKQGWSVAIGWGCGAIVAAIATMLTIAILTKALGL
jgi:hypothetical protein